MGHGHCFLHGTGWTWRVFHTCNGTDWLCGHLAEGCTAPLGADGQWTKAVCINQTFVSCTSSNDSDRNQTFCDEKECGCEGHRWNQEAGTCSPSSSAPASQKMIYQSLQSSSSSASLRSVQVPPIRGGALCSAQILLPKCSQLRFS